MTIRKIKSKEAYSGDTFRKLDLEKAEIAAAHFSDCAFIGCDFSESVLKSCRFIDCEFQDCAMKMTRLDNTTFVSVRFSRCNLLGVNWTEADWSAWSVKLRSLEFDNCTLNYGIFLGLDIQRMILKDCDAHEVNFAQANLTESNFSGTDFAGAVFLGTDLTRVNFAGAKNYALNVHDNRVRDARFSLPEAIRLLYHMDIVIVDPDTDAEMDENRFNDSIA